MPLFIDLMSQWVNYSVTGDLLWSGRWPPVSLKYSLVQSRDWLGRLGHMMDDSAQIPFQSPKEWFKKWPNKNVLTLTDVIICLILNRDLSEWGFESLYRINGQRKLITFDSRCGWLFPRVRGFGEIVWQFIPCLLFFFFMWKLAHAH